MLFAESLYPAACPARAPHDASRVLLCSVPVVPGGAALLEPHQGDACFTCGMNANKGIKAHCALASYHMFLAVALVQQGHGRRGLVTVPSKMLCAVLKFVRAAVWTAITRSATYARLNMRSAPIICSEPSELVKHASCWRLCRESCVIWDTFASNIRHLVET